MSGRVTPMPSIPYTRSQPAKSLEPPQCAPINLILPFAGARLCPPSSLSLSISRSLSPLSRPSTLPRALRFFVDSLRLRARLDTISYIRVSRRPRNLPCVAIVSRYFQFLRQSHSHGILTSGGLGRILFQRAPSRIPRYRNGEVEGEASRIVTLTARKSL